MSKNFVEVKPSECKGCKVCIEACSKKCLFTSSKINNLGYQYTEFVNNACIGCGLCFYVCPEPGAITVYKGEKGE